MENFVDFAERMIKKGKVKELITHLQQSNPSLEDLTRLLSEIPNIDLDQKGETIPVFDEVLLHVFRYIISCGAVFDSNLYDEIAPLAGEEVFSQLFWALGISELRQRAACIIALCAIPLFNSLIEWTGNGIMIIGGEANRLYKTYERLDRLLTPGQPAEKLALSTYCILRFSPEKWAEWWGYLFDFFDDKYTMDEAIGMPNKKLNGTPIIEEIESFDVTAFQCWRWGEDSSTRTQQLKMLLQHFDPYDDSPFVISILDIAEKRFSNFDSWNSYMEYEWMYASDLATQGDFFEVLGDEWRKLDELSRSSTLLWSAFEKYQKAYRVMGQVIADGIITRGEVIDDFNQYYSQSFRVLNHLMVGSVNVDWIYSEQRSLFNPEVYTLVSMLLTPTKINETRIELRKLKYIEDSLTLFAWQSHNQDILPALYWAMGADVELLTIFLSALIYPDFGAAPPDIELLLQVLPILTEEQSDVLKRAFMTHPAIEDNMPMFVSDWQEGSSEHLRMFISFLLSNFETLTP